MNNATNAMTASDTLQMVYNTICTLPFTDSVQAAYPAYTARVNTAIDALSAIETRLPGLNNDIRSKAEDLKDLLEDMDGESALHNVGKHLKDLRTLAEVLWTQKL